MFLQQATQTVLASGFERPIPEARPEEVELWFALASLAFCFALYAVYRTVTRSCGRDRNAPLLALLLTTASLGSAEWARADETQDQVIDQIVVVAHKDERSVRDIAANVTVLSRDALSDQLAVSMADVFRYVPGIDYEAAGTRFGTEGFNIRGIGGNRVAILVDGVPLPDQFDTGSFSNATRDFIDAGLIQDVEVLHGPASALYGSSAIGGVVAVQTPDPVDFLRRERFGADVAATWRGADNSLQSQALIALGDESLGILVGASYRDGGEIESNARQTDLDTRDYQRQTAMLKLVSDNRWGHTFKASVTHQQSETLSDLNSLLGTGRYRSTTALEGDDRYDLKVANLSYEFGSPESFVDTGIVRAFWETVAVEQDTLDERGNSRRPVSIDRFFSYDQEVRGVEVNLWKNKVTGTVLHRVGVGLEYRERITEEYRDGLSTSLTSGAQTNVLLGENFPLRDFPISTSTESAAFIEDTISLGKWKLIAALRAERFDLSPRIDAMYREDYPTYGAVSISESDVSPKLGLIYNVAPELDIYLQYSHGFRAPPYSDANVSLDIPFFAYRAIPNPDLKSESSRGYELGLRWQTLRASLWMSLFHTDYDDFIETKVNVGVDSQSGYTEFQSQNIRDTEIRGVELGWRQRFGLHEQFTVDASAYYARGKNNDTGEPLNSVGPAQGVLGLSWTSRNERRVVRIAGSFTQAFDRRDESAGEVFKPAGHAVLDVFVTQRLGNHTILRTGLHNLSDRTYWNWSDVRGLSPDDPILPFLAQAGRTASVSLNVAW